MKIKTLVIWSVAVCAMPLYADEVVISTNTNLTSKTTTINSSTIGAATVLSPGRYMTTIAPGFDGNMADRLKKAFGALPGVRDVEALLDDSSVHFTLKEGAHIRVADIQRIVAKADASAVSSTPILESSLKNHPGL